MLAAWSGLVVGAAHVATGPDHLAAVAPLAIDSRRRHPPALIGATWGLGHGLGVLLIGLLGQVLKVGFRVETVAGWAEHLVGVLLIGLGLWTLHRSRRLVVHDHAHVHGGREHTHLHVHEHDPAGGDHRSAHAQGPHQHSHAALGIGVLHGLAGSNHLLGVLPSLAMAERQAVLYLAGYLAAAVLTMALFGALIGWITEVAGTDKIPAALRAAGWTCLALGVVWLGLGVWG